MRSRSTCFFLLLIGVITANPRCIVAQSAEKILEAARLNPTSQPAELNARIRSDGTITPVTITLRDHVISYEFENPKQALRLKLGPKLTRLSEQLNDVTKPVPATRLQDEVRNSGLTYEDLSLGFLYWPDPVIQGQETLRTRTAWKIDLQAPVEETLYGVARVWIDKESGAILRIEGYDKHGLLLRRFEIISAQKIGNLWMLKQMRIEGFTLGNPSPVSRRYLLLFGKNCP